MFVSSGYLYCVGCCANFAVNFGESRLPDLRCTYCGESLTEVALETFSSVDQELAMIGGPWPEMVNAAFDSRERDLLSPDIEKRPDGDRVELHGTDFTRLLEGVEFEVRVTPLTLNKSLTIDRWVAVLPDLDASCEDIGVDAALIGLVEKVSACVTELIAEDSPERRDLLPLLLKLWYADQQSRLGKVLEAASVLVDWEYEHDAC